MSPESCFCLKEISLKRYYFFLLILRFVSCWSQSWRKCLFFPPNITHKGKEVFLLFLNSRINTEKLTHSKFYKKSAIFPNYTASFPQSAEFLNILTAKLRCSTNHLSNTLYLDRKSYCEVFLLHEEVVQVVMVCLFNSVLFWLGYWSLFQHSHIPLCNIFSC